MPFNNRFEKAYKGENAMHEVHDTFLNMERELTNIGIPHGNPEYFGEGDEPIKNARARCILANSLPLAEVILQGTQWIKDKTGLISLNLKYFKEGQNFPEINEMCSHYGLEDKGVKKEYADRR